MTFLPLLTRQKVDEKVHVRLFIEGLRDFYFSKRKTHAKKAPLFYMACNLLILYLLSIIALGCIWQDKSLKTTTKSVSFGFDLILGPFTKYSELWN